MQNKDRKTSVAMSLLVITGYLLFFILQAVSLSGIRARGDLSQNWLSFYLFEHTILISLVSILLVWIWFRRAPVGSYFTFYFAWVLANYVGGLIGIIFLGFSIDNVEVPIFYAVLGIAQALVLKRRFTNANQWILLTIYGAVISFILVFLISKVLDFYSIDLPLLGLGIIIGLSLGTAQWIFLKRWVKRAGWWIIGSTISVSTVALINYDCNCGPESIFSALANLGIVAAFLGGVYGIISGIFIVAIIAPNLLRISDKALSGISSSDTTTKS